MTATRPFTTAAVATRLVVAVLLGLALLPPLSWVAVATLLEHQRIRERADLLTTAVDTPGGQAESLLARAAHYAGTGSTAAWVALRGADGRATWHSGAAPGWPSLGVLRTIEAAGGADGTVVELRRSLRPALVGGAVVGLVSAALALGLWHCVFRRPVRRLENAEGRIRSHARLDRLTGLLNREALNGRLAEAVARSGGGSASVGALVLDIDRFNLVNGSVGQTGGDELLRAVADRLRVVVRRGDAAARLNADQFAIVIERISSAHVLAGMARNVHRAFESPFVVGDREMIVTLSIGGAITGGPGTNVDALLRQASAAMRAAKAAGGARFRLFEATMDDDAEGRLDMDLRLRRALAAGQFFLMYQPIVDAQDRRIVAVEALLRWASADRGLVPPSEFIPVLEQTGLIIPVGHWVLQEACRRAAQWRREGAEDLVLSVNLSPRQFAEADFVSRLRATLQATGFPATQLQLEVTEGLLLEPTTETMRRIEEIADLGVRLAVDDFGMGYSSLAYLKRFRLHGLKIDRMFVQDIGSGGQDLAIVRAIVDLGHGLGLSVTAEGVETEAQCRALCEMGCDTLQGFLFARPLAASDLPVVEAARALAETPDTAPASTPGDLALAR